MNTSPNPLTSTSALVLGSTGKTGRRVVAGLQHRGVRVRAASRRSRHVAARFDWADRRTWAAALDGMDSVYVTYQPDLAVPGAADQVGALAHLAAQSGVSRLVLLSGRGEPAAEQAEQAVFAAFPNAAVVRCAWFAQNFTEGALLDAVRSGAITLPAAAHTTEPFVDADDIAACVIELLTGPDRGGQVYEITGPEAVPLAVAAEVLSAAASWPVEYVPVTESEFAALLMDDGVPPDEAAGLAASLSQTFDGRNESTTDTIAELLGRSARSFEDFAWDAAAAGAFATARTVVGS